MDEHASVIADIVRDCLQFDPASRPSANDIAERLVRWQFREEDLNRDENGNTIIHRIAAQEADESGNVRESLNKLEELLDPKKPVMINAVNHLGDTPLMLVKHRFLIKRLLEYRRVPLSNEEPSRLMECYHNIDIFGTLLKLAEKERVNMIRSLRKNSGFQSHIVKDTFAQRNRIHKDGETPLHIAARIGNFALFEALLDLDVFDAWKANTNGRTALHIASLHGHAEIMRKLINLQNPSGQKEDVQSAGVNIQDETGKTPLHIAAASRNLSAARTLLDHSTTSVNLRDVEERSAIFEVVSETSIDASAQAKVFQAFVQHRGIDLSMKDSRGETVFHQLARGDLVQSAQILVERDDVKLSNRESEHWYTPLHLAVREQSFRVARMWLARDDVDVNLIDKHGNTLVHILAALRTSVDGNHMILVSFAKTLISRDDVNLSLRNARGDTALHVAVHSNNTIVAEALLSEANNKVTGNDLTALHLHPDSSVAKVMGSVDVNARDRYDKTPLHLASYGNASEVAKLLISRGDVDVNARDKDQQTPLHLASRENASEVAALLLLRSDVDVNARNKVQETPLHKASDYNAAEVAAMLLGRDDVDVNARSRFQHTPLHYASARNAAKVAKLLLSRDDVDVNAQKVSQRTPLHLASMKNAAEVAKLLLLRDDVDVNARDEDLQTPLHWASERSAYKVAKLLLLRDNVDVNAQDADQRTPLHKASWKNAAEVAKLILSRDDIDVNARNKEGKTALHLASMQDAAGVAAMLLSRNDVDVNARDEDGKTALDFAERWSRFNERYSRWGIKDCAELLRARGATSTSTSMPEG